MSGRHSAPIRVPGGWRCSEDPETGVLLRARAIRPGASGVVPRLRFDIEPVTTSLHEWRADDLAALISRRSGFELDDEDEFELGGWDLAYRRYSYQHGDDDLLCEEFAWLVEGVGHVLTCTIARADYADYCEEFEELAASFDPTRPPGSLAG